MNPEIIQDTPILDEVMLQEAERKERAAEAYAYRVEAHLRNAEGWLRRLREFVKGRGSHENIETCVNEVSERLGLLEHEYYWLLLEEGRG